MRARRHNDEVYIAATPVVRVSSSDVDWLTGLAAGTKRRRVRLCAHQEMNDAVHEMLIVLDRATYVRPHRHRNKSESFHVVTGTLSVLLFDNDGELRDSIRLGEYASGRPFYFRLSEPLYHAVLVESAQAVVHETTTGSFDRADTEFGPWSPSEESPELGLRYLRGCLVKPVAVDNLT